MPFAVDYTYIGANGDPFETDSNWDPTGVPGVNAGDTIAMPTTAPAAPIDPVTIAAPIVLGDDLTFDASATLSLAGGDTGLESSVGDGSLLAVAAFNCPGATLRLALTGSFSIGGNGTIVVRTATYAEAVDVRLGVDRGDGITGQLDLPAASDVKLGVVFDNTFQTGTYAAGGGFNIFSGKQIVRGRNDK